MPFVRFLRQLPSIADVGGWPLVMLAAVIITLWSLMFQRALHDDRLVVGEAYVNHGNVAIAMANYLEVKLERLRFYGQTLALGATNETSRQLIRRAKRHDGSFLRLIQFDAAGEPIFSTGIEPEPWLREMARIYAGQPTSAREEAIVIGADVLSTVPTAQTWSLPILYRAPGAGTAGAGFTIALVDLGDFPTRFDRMALGDSGEIVLIHASGREVFRLHRGRLDSVAIIDGTERFRRTFAEPAGSGTLAEADGDAAERLYAYQHIADTPLAVLVSRTRADVLRHNSDNRLGYGLTTLGLTVLMVFLTLRWIGTARRKRELLERLIHAQEQNTALIAQLEQEKQVAYRLATHDKLTGLANRMLFADIAEHYVARAKRSSRQLAVMFIDLDRFKPINDTYGHKAGDKLLIEVARRLEACMRQTDLVARFGGDEFVALVADLHDSRGATAIAHKIIESLRQPFVGIVDDELFVTPSIGIAFYPRDSDDIDQLVRQADGAMYQAKAQGRATFVFTDPNLNRRNDLKNQILAALPLALKNREITMHYQPKVSLADFRIVGLEALARWHSPLLGDVSPADFVPLAEESSLIQELGEYVIERVCEQQAAWQHAGLPMVPVAVNISPRQLRNARLYEFIETILAIHGLAPRQLEIEITETGLIDSDEQLLSQLRNLDALGIRLAIDDFGTGFSGLSNLRALPLNYLKIDKSFIKDIRNDINDAAIVSSIISLAHNLHLQAIAEGVETREQLVHLRAAGCDQAQGYWFARPLPADQTTPLLQQRFLTTATFPAGIRRTPRRTDDPTDQAN